MFKHTLHPKLATAVMDHLQIVASQPDQRQLDRLLNAYVRTVPWESAFRIAKRAEMQELAACPRWPEEFWQDHLQKGGGGTCFESNYAFYSLLCFLGYDGYLTINNMGESIGCHTAIIIILDEQKWLVDAGFPLYAPLPISPNGVLYRDTKFFRYIVHPQEPGQYQIVRRPHPNWNAFTLIDKPVNDEEYRQATMADYGPGGHFLDRVIIHKIIDELPWRFVFGDEPYQFGYFNEGDRYDEFPIGDMVTAVAGKFCLDEETLRFALSAIVT